LIVLAEHVEATMSRLGIFLVVALAALAQASLPTNSNQGAAKLILRQQRINAVELKGKPLCEECEKLVTALKKVVDNPEAEQKLVNTLKAACDLPFLASFKDRCLNVVNNIVVIIHEAQSLLDNPTQVCEAVKLCSGETPSFQSAAQRLFLAAASKVVQDALPQANPDSCTVCNNTMNALRWTLEYPTLVDTLKDEIEQVCQYLGAFNDSCTASMDKNFKTFYTDVVDTLFSYNMCIVMTLCKRPSTFINVDRVNRLSATYTRPHLDTFLANISTIQTRLGFDFGCFACKSAFDAALDLLKQDTVETTIATDVTKMVCNLLPNTLQAGCFDFMGIYGKASLQLTLNEWTPDDICQAMHVCSASALHQLQLASQAGKVPIVCDACKALTKTLAFELQQPGLQQDIINVLTHGCHLLPGKLANKCGDLVIEYVPTGIGWAADFLSRDDVCSVVHLC